jgi:probable F420-dependent oxidoreductase
MGSMTNDDVRQRLGRIGIWMGGPERAGVDAPAVASAVEAAGFGSLWVGGGNVTPDAFDRLRRLLENTTRLIVATGIASIWARPAQEMRTGAARLAESFPDRFILGLGVSHGPMVPGYSRPLEKMRDYLGELGELPCPVILAALGPKMLELSRDRADGAHPYFTTPEHTATARAVLGSAPLLVPEQAVILGGDRTGARAYAETYLNLPNYTRSLRRLGFTGEDLASGGSDRLIDAIIPQDAEGVTRVVREHLDAGADHVVIQPLNESVKFSVADLRPLAQMLGGR